MVLTSLDLTEKFRQCEEFVLAERKYQAIMVGEGSVFDKYDIILCDGDVWVTPIIYILHIFFVVK